MHLLLADLGGEKKDNNLTAILSSAGALQQHQD